MRLSELHHLMTTLERRELAKKVGVDPGYLWQLATGWRGKAPSLRLIAKLARADGRLTTTELVEEFAPDTAAESQEQAA